MSRINIVLLRGCSTGKNPVLQPLVLFIGKLTVIQVVEQQKST